MKRRSFLTTIALVSAGISTLLVSSSSQSSNKNEEASIHLDDYKKTFELDEETIGSSREKLASGKYASQELVHLYLKRIETIDKNGPRLNSVIEINPDAVAMDKELKAGNFRGHLHGIPIFIKDNIDTADKMQTTVGPLAMDVNIASKRCFCSK